MTDIPSGYTPGPWNADGPDWAGDYNITPPHEAAVVAAVISNVRPASEVEANARLIALAPEMADEITRLRAEVARYRAALIYLCEKANHVSQLGAVPRPQWVGLISAIVKARAALTAQEAPNANNNS